VSKTIQFTFCRGQNRLPQGGWIELPLQDLNVLRTSVKLDVEAESLIEDKQTKLDHVRVSRMRRSVQKHRLNQGKNKKV